MTSETRIEVSLAVRAPSAPVVAISSIILSIGLTAIGNGLMFAYIPVRLGAEGFAPTWAGLILTGLSAGGMAGCLMTGRIVRRVGHARAFMVFSAMVVLSNAAIGAIVDPLAWIISRALYGFAINGMFIVGQSWLNDVVENAIRGRVMAIFYVAYVVGLGAGSYTLGLIDLEASNAPLIGIAFTAFAMLPVGMTRLRQPPPPESASVALLEAWRISPVGIAGMLAAGGLSMMVAGFTPIHATASGYEQAEVALLMAAMPIGTLIFQIPFGWISDRTDRRHVLILAALLVAVGGLAAMGFDGSRLAVMIVIYVIWSGATESIYSLASAHANDRAEPHELVTLSSTMLFAWSLSGFLVPAFGTALTAIFGTQAFMGIAVAIAVLFAIFVGWRVMRTKAPGQAEVPGFAPMTAQAPLPVDLAFPAPEEDGAAGPASPASEAEQKPLAS
jgi:MFS family permease